ncbi:MAG: hypothetical protein RIS88_1844 [Pseudomonadota bacterium]|jgi:hypothetical protein
MNVTTRTPALHPLQDQFGQRVAARLSEGAAQLPYDIAERLRAARARATAGRKREAIVPVRSHALAGAGRLVDEGLSLWGRLASALPGVVLAAGLVTIHFVQNELRASEVAEVDAALLTDDLPPAAYTDPGFVRFLQSED